MSTEINTGYEKQVVLECVVISLDVMFEVTHFLGANGITHMEEPHQPP